jgi:hypothetical protein
MIYGLNHLASNLPVLLVRGRHKNTRLPTSNFRNLTFGSLHALVSSWYFCKFATALSLSDSNRSFSSALLGHTGTSITVHKLQCFTFSGRTTSALYISRNGIKFVALHIVVLWLHTACGMISVHFPFFSPSSIFLIASNIRPLTLSTAHAELIKSCDALESNNIMMGHSLRKIVPASTSSPVGISSTVV